MSGLNWVLTGVLAAMVLAGGGCGSTQQAPMGSGCMPPPFSLSADALKPGSSLTVKAADADCDPRYGTGAQIKLEITDGSGNIVVDTLAPMNDAGGFSAAVTLPESAVPGRGSVAAYPYDLDWCDDTGRNNRVGNPGADGALEETGIERASCMMPSKPLVIEP